MDPGGEAIYWNQLPSDPRDNNHHSLHVNFPVLNARRQYNLKEPFILNH